MVSFRHLSKKSFGCNPSGACGLVRIDAAGATANLFPDYFPHTVSLPMFASVISPPTLPRISGGNTVRIAFNSDML